MAAKILIVEDQLIVRKGIRMIVEQNPELVVIGEAMNGVEAIKLVEQELPDLILLDIRMPEMDGVATVKVVKERWPEVKILVLTTFNDDGAALETLKDGVNGFMLKTAEPEKLIQSIHSCLSGVLVLHEEVAARMVPMLSERKVEKQTNEGTLTEREMDIVRLVGTGKTNKEIAQQLYLSVGTVKNHITNILQQLDLRDRTQLAIYAVKNDLID
ncbi:response regulator [Chungangia koreensis]|uniref:Response regulator n=1 Tax=Chungangia koreensis TaxID=752657 RepID=A0ABV8X8T7_9LACT